jgi:hypothetical protein
MERPEETGSPKPNGRHDQMTTNKARAIAGLRIMLGAGLLYAGLEKVLQLAGTGAFNAAGFLSHATGGALPGSAATAIVLRPRCPDREDQLGRAHPGPALRARIMSRSR